MPSIDYDQPIPLFPLPNVVLLPHATLPLHIFEPRYRLMTADALAGPRLIAMASFSGDAWQSQYEGRPPLRPAVCVGLISRHVRLADGRYNLLLDGLVRAAIEWELEPGPEDTPYRRAMLRPLRGLSDAPSPRDRLDLLTLLDRPAFARHEMVCGIRNWVNDHIPTEALIDVVASALMEDLHQRYDLLAQADASLRAAAVISHVRDLADRIEQRSPLDARGCSWN